MRHPLGLVIIVMLLLAGGFFLYSNQVRDRYAASAAAYLDTAMTAIASWRPEDLREHLSSEARAVIDARQLAALTERYAELGQFERLENVTFTRLSVLASLLNRQRLLSYNAQAHFANGSAQLSATLTEQNGSFRLYNFNLSNPRLGLNDSRQGLNNSQQGR